MLLSSFQMFSLEHLITILVIIMLALCLFFTRRLFIKYPIADKIFRYFLAALIMGSEIWLRRSPSTNVYAWNMPIPLCGHLLWIAGLALLANSERIYRRIYPLCLTGALLSMIVVEGIPHFPEFRFCQYFFVHGGFMLGALYFVFTRKINKFDFKDYGWSCLLLLAMGAVMSIFVITGVRDEYMAINPVKPLEPIRDALGQVGYTAVYILFIALVMLMFSTITYFLTRGRDDNSNAPVFKENKYMSYISMHYNKRARWITVSGFIICFMYLLACQFKVATSPNNSFATPLAYILLVENILAFGAIIFNEILLNYENSLENQA